MSTKHQWLSATGFAQHLHPQIDKKILTGAAEPMHHFFKQRVEIPSGWFNLKRLLPTTTGVLVLLLFIFGVAVPQAKAEIIITEVFPAPDSNGQEWVELYNDSTATQNLDGWFLEDRITSASFLYWFEDITLEPGDFYTVSWPSSKLNNSGDSVYLYDFNLQDVDHFSYTSSETNKSWSRIETESGIEWQLTDPTPNKANHSTPAPIVITPMLCTEPSPTPPITPSPTTQASPSPSQNTAQDYDIYISAVMACPLENQKEYIEIFNTTNQELSVEGWYVLDAADNKRFLLTDSEPALLGAESFTTIYFTSAFINNSGETLFLYSPNGTLVQTIELPHCDEKGIAFTQQTDSWSQQTNQGTVTQSQSNTTVSTASTKETVDSSETMHISTSSTGTVLGTTKTIQPQIKINELKLDIPQTSTQLFNEPQQLLKESIPYLSPQGILNIIAGGILVAGSSSYKLLQNLGIL